MYSKMSYIASGDLKKKYAMWIERNLVSKIQEAVQARPVVLLTGVRQAGKSSLLQRMFSEAEYVTLDRVAMATEAEENPTRFLNRFKKQVIIDEIQYAPSLFRHLKIKIDEERKVMGKWILTGSQHFGLMQGVKESLAGRIRILRLGPLSAAELNEANLLHNRRDYLWKGGFPEIWAENLDAGDFFDDYIQTYLERDVKQVINVNNLRDFRRFLSMIALRTGQLINYSEISRDLGIAVNTVKNWTNALEITGVIILVPPYYNNLGKRLIKSPKLYFVDNGLVAALLNLSSRDALFQSPNLGNIWENCVLSEFVKEGFTAGKELFYLRDQNGVEIDFILEKTSGVCLIEAKTSEFPNPGKLNFHKIAPLFKKEVHSVVACAIEEEGLVSAGDYSMYNPLYGNMPIK